MKIKFGSLLLTTLALCFSMVLRSTTSLYGQVSGNPAATSLMSKLSDNPPCTHRCLLGYLQVFPDSCANHPDYSSQTSSSGGTCAWTWPPPGPKSWPNKTTIPEGMIPALTAPAAKLIPSSAT